MTNETKQTILAALERYRGDDYDRAKAAFSRCTPEQMNEVWSGNGETRQQVLDGYREHVERVERAKAEVAHGVR